MAGRVKGIVLQSRRSFVVEKFGEAALERILAKLPDEDTKVLRGILVPMSWYSADTATHFDDAIIAVAGGDARRAFWDLGRRSAEDNLTKFQAGFVRSKTPEAFLAQTSTIYRMYYETGTREWVPNGERSGALVTRGAENVTSGDCLTVMGWYERALEMVGAKAPKIVHPTCRAKGGTECRYDVSWS